MQKKSLLMAAAAVACSVASAQAAITVTSGEFDPSATLTGSVRFRNLNNSGNSSVREIYLANIPSELDNGATRTEQNYGWNTPPDYFRFIWDKPGDQIQAIVSPDNDFSDNDNTTVSRTAFTNPTAANEPNYIRVLAVDGGNVDGIQITLTSLDGNPLAGANLVGTASGAYLSITDPTLLKDGFILSGSVQWNTANNNTPSSEDRDKYEISFGYSPNVVVPEPSTYIAGALVGLPLLISTFRHLRKKA